MTRQLPKIALALVTFWTIAIGVIRAQPYDDTTLDPLLTPPAGCAMPCFIGVQPGVTTWDDSIGILESNQWVEGVYTAANTIDWLWNGRQPAIFDTSSQFFQGRVEFGNIDDSHRITTIAIKSTLTFGDLWLVLGRPDRVTLYAPNAAPPSMAIYYAALYERYDLYVFNLLVCPIRRDDFWNKTVYVAFGKPHLPYEPTTELTPDGSPDWFFHNETLGC
jgi:hypothetical protein